MRLKKVKNAGTIIEQGRYYLADYQAYRGHFEQLFNNNNPLYIEIGMGKGDFIIGMATAFPNINFIGIEKYDSVLVRAIQKSNELELNNLKLIRMDAKNINEIFDHEVAVIYLNFSDPWPKERHARRRLTSPTFLEKYEQIFKPDCQKIIMKTDNINLFNYSLETLKDFKYTIKFLTNNLAAEDVFNIKTEYENKFQCLGIKINKLVAEKNNKR